MKILKTAPAIVALCSALTLLIGCSGTSETPTYVRDIKPLVDTKCAGCHTEGGIAPFPLKTYEQVSAMRAPVSASVVARTMPPWLADRDCAEYHGDRSLTDAQINDIKRWADAGAPLGDPNDTPVSVADNRVSLSRIDRELQLPVPYTPQNFPDDYRCFFLDWPASATTYITGFGVMPDNPKIVHHAIAYVVRPENLAIFQALEDADPQPGWACFGSPMGNQGATTGPGKFSWLGGWAPGGTGEDFPPGTGIEVPVGAKLIVQVHYYSASRVPAPDQTKILIRTDAAVQKKAAVIPFSNPQWLMGNMNIPAHSMDVMHSFEMDPTLWAPLASGGTIAGGKPLTLYAAGQHMHLLATRSMARLNRASGSSECLLEIPRWDFHWQSNHTFGMPRQMIPGDKLYLECHFDNPGTKDVNWGEGTSDEMCLGIYYITE